MRRLHILFALMLSLFCANTLSAQSVQKVRVVEYNGKEQKTPLANAALSVQNAASTMSDAEGNLTLNFRTLKAGDVVSLKRVDLAGYEIFNKDAVEQWVISQSETFELVLCKTEKIMALYDQYMSVASASYEKQWKREQAALEAERQAGRLKDAEYQQKLQEAQDAYDQQLENLELYVEKFAHFDLSKLSTEEQAIIELVQAGQLDEAIARYEQMDLLGSYQQQSRELRQIVTTQDSLTVIRAEKEAVRDTLKAVVDQMEQIKQK